MGMKIPLGQTARRTHGVLCRLPRIAGLKKILGGILFLSLVFHSIPAFSATVPAGQSVTMVWSPCVDANVAGYNIYYGVASGTYTGKITVGNVMNATISGLVTGVTYYIAATTYNAGGEESGYSNESIYEVPVTLSGLQISRAPAGQFTLTMGGLTGHTYQILATQDFTAWTVIGTVTAGAGGLVNFTDTNAASYSRRFYRTQILF
jgi:hypothetical protein